MTPEQYERIRALFDQAHDLPSDRRGPFLDERCPDDAEVRRKVLSMLDQDDTAGTMLERPALGAGFHVGRTLDQPHPTQIDQYRIVRLIGEGGMGRVYEGVQENPRRTVAIKLLRPGTISRGMLKRFEHEAHVLGRLQHPGIGQIYEAGTFDAGSGAQPYFAMEYVEGRPLTQYAEESGLGQRERLKLMVQICDAVQHAHQRGIIHRDLKPDNILIDQAGRPKVLDFGVARITDADVQLTTIQTNVGQLIGTLQYMSPEQCEADPGDLDVRSDVYALGVILYELLCGQRPYELANVAIHEAVRVIREQPPTRPSAINRALRGDLETIALKALEKDRARRYQSPGDLAQDIQRHLGDEPILARPPSALYQLAKFARRHRATAAALAAVVVVLVGGIVASTTFAVRESIARDTAEQRTREVELINDFLQRMLEQADPWKAGGEVTIATAIERAAALVDESFAGKPALEATMRQTMGRTYVGLGLFDDAVRHLQDAVELHRTEFGDRDRRTLDSELQMGLALFSQDRLDEASDLIERVLNLARAELGPEAPMTLEVQVLLGRIRHRQGRWDDADALCRAAADIQERTLGPDDLETVETVEILGWNHLRLGRLDEARASFERVQARHLAVEGEDSPRRVTSLNGLATVAYDELRYEDAERLYQEALDLSDRIFGEDHPNMVVAMTGLANVMSALDQREQAEPLAREAARIYGDRLGPDHQHTLIAVDNLGVLIAQLGKFDEAEQLLSENLAVRRRVLGDDHPDVAATCNSLGVLAYQQEHWEVAADWFSQAVQGYDRAFREPTTSSVTALVNMAACLNRVGRFQEAVTAMEDVLAFDRAMLAPDHVILSNDLATYAEALEGLGRYEEALAACRECIAILEQRDDPARKAVRQGLLGGLLIRTGSEEEGEAVLLDAWNVLTAMDRAADARGIAERLAAYYGAQRRTQEAALWNERIEPPEEAGS